jgi:hypothetical protein
MKEQIDVSRLVAEIRARGCENARLKKALSERWTGPMADVQRALVASRRRTTELVILRAWLRGRLHLQRPLRERAYPGMAWDRERYHRLVAERLAAEFQRAGDSVQVAR